MTRTVIALLLAVLVLLPTGCRSKSNPATLTPQEQAERRAKLEMARDDLAHIPPPSKNLYMNVQSTAQWENPLLTVQADMITLTILRADANPSPVGKGTLLRPVAARKDVVSIRLSDLAEALNAVPRDAWPYGRVVAVEEAHNAPKQVLPQIRRNIESTMQTLSDLGIVADEWNDQKPVGVR
ncbi:MAG: hypothetical protein JSS87_08155 [Acidobacteria bacterium]|nr:hypothetical protein [Acidobacteriota bacterium]